MKGWSRKKKEALFIEDYEAIKELASSIATLRLSLPKPQGDRLFNKDEPPADSNAISGDTSSSSVAEALS